MVVGAPVLKQWRAKDNQQDSCQLSTKIMEPHPPCLLGKFETKDMWRPEKVANNSMVSRAYVNRIFPGDLEWPTDWQGYDPESYALELPINPAQCHSDDAQADACEDRDGSAHLEILKDGNWTDFHTRAIGFEVSFYSPNWDRLTLVQLLTEFQADAGIRSHPRIRTFKINSWNFRPWPEKPDFAAVRANAAAALAATAREQLELKPTWPGWPSENGGFKQGLPDLAWFVWGEASNLAETLLSVASVVLRVVRLPAYNFLCIAFLYFCLLSECFVLLAIPYILVGDIYRQRIAVKRSFGEVWKYFGDRSSFGDDTETTTWEDFLKYIATITSLFLDGYCMYHLIEAGFRERQVWLSVERIKWGNTQSYQPMHTLAYNVEAQTGSVAVVTLLLWAKLLTSKLQAFRKITILLAAIKQMVMELLSFFWILAIFYIAFGTTKFILPHYAAEKRDYTTAVIAEFWASIDEEISDKDADDGRSDSFFVNMLSPAFAVLVIVILMNVLVTMLMDLYTREKDAAEAHWCREQTIMIFREQARENRAREAREKRNRARTGDSDSDGEGPDDSGGHGVGGGFGGAGGGDTLSPLASGQRLRRNSGGKDRFKKAARKVILINKMSRPLYTEFEQLSDVAEGMLVGDPKVMDDQNFRRYMIHHIPELLFFVGDIRTPDGISTANNEKISEIIMRSLYAVRNMVAPRLQLKPGDVLVKGAPATFDTDEYREWALREVGLEDKEILAAFMVALTIHQLCKVQLWKDTLVGSVLKKYKDSIDDNHLMNATLRAKECHSKFLPSLRMLPAYAQLLIEQVYQAEFIFGQILQLECVPASLLDLQEIAVETSDFDGRKAMNFCIFSQVVAIFANFKSGEVPYFLYRVFFDAMTSLQPLAGGTKAVDVYAARLNSSAQKLDVEAELEEVEEDLEDVYDKFHHNSSDWATFEDFSADFKKAYLRVAAFCRYNKKSEQSEALLHAFLNLDSDMIVDLIKELNRTGIDDGWAILLMYTPDMFQSLANPKAGPSVPLQARLVLALRLLHFLYKTARKVLEFKLIMDESDDEGTDEDDEELEDEAEGNGNGRARAGSISEQREPGQNGVYRVGCYQVAQWSKFAKVVGETLREGNKRVILEHNFLHGTSGEAEFRMQFRSSHLDF
jgi:hypothetical protein